MWIRSRTLLDAAWLAPIALILAGFGLRVILLHAFPLREDEALYAYWALHSWRADPFFLSVWPDKPPLFLWALAGGLRLFGTSAAAARWLDLACSTLLIAVVAATARRAWGRTAALAAAVVITLNPYAISFGPTVYTDPLLVLAGILALCCAVYGWPLWAGVWLGAAIMTKQQGVAYAPLVAGALILYTYRKPGDGWKTPTYGMPKPRAVGNRTYTLFLAGVASVVLPILYWDSLRWQVAPSPWDLSARNYAPIRLLAPGEWPARIAEWREPAWYLMASWPAWIGLAALVIVAGLGTGAPKIKNQKSIIKNGDALFWLIAAWGALFGLAHMIVSVQAWDRYLLPLAPVIALLAGRLWAAVAPYLARPAQAGLVLAGVLVLAAPALRATAGRLPIGGDHGAYAGLEQVAARLAAANEHMIVYHQNLGWHYRYYLYDQVEAGQVELRWFPSPVYLADNAAKTPYPRKFLATADWATPPDLEAHLAMRGLTLNDQGKWGHFHLWEIVHTPVPPCTWCVCRLDTPFAATPGAPEKMTPR